MRKVNEITLDLLKQEKITDWFGGYGLKCLNVRVSEQIKKRTGFEYKLDWNENIY